MRARSVSPLPFCLVLALLPAAAAAAPATLRLGNGEAKIATLDAGDDLWVGLDHAAPGGAYQLRLESSGGVEIAAASAIADEEGTVEGVRLWSSSGVVGCGCVETADPELFRFRDFTAAEEALDGQELRITAIGTAGEVAAEARLPVTTSAAERVFFADADGCPRAVFAVGDPVYLGFLHADPDHLQRVFFFEKGGAVQKLELPAGEAPLIEIEGPGADEGGPYSGLLIRITPPGIEEPMPPPQRLDRPRLPESGGGILITMDGCPPKGGSQNAPPVGI